LPATPRADPGVQDYRTGLLPRVRRRGVILPLVLWTARSTLLPASVCRSRSSAQSSPWPGAFSPRTPQVIGRFNPVERLCSLASQILCTRPTSQWRTCRDCDHRSSSTGPNVMHDRPPLRFPGFRAKSLHACSGSLAPRVRVAARNSAMLDIAFPTKSQGRHPEG
jgi:hypothetical protein